MLKKMKTKKLKYTGTRIIESLRLKYRKQHIKYTCEKRRTLIINKDFTIISNNCWGGFIYQSYKLPYNTPTVGLFFMAADYIKFITNLELYTNSQLTFINPYESTHVEKLKEDKNFGTYPIGKLNDIEIMFLHYKTNEEAYEKWTKRCNRINWDKLIIKFNDQNNCKDEYIYSFDKLDYKNKICFTVKEYPGTESVIYLKGAKNQKEVTASQEPYGKTNYININEIINSL